MIGKSLKDVFFNVNDVLDVNVMPIVFISERQVYLKTMSSCETI